MPIDNNPPPSQHPPGTVEPLALIAGQWTARTPAWCLCPPLRPCGLRSARGWAGARQRRPAGVTTPLVDRPPTSLVLPSWSPEPVPLLLHFFASGARGEEARGGFRGLLSAPRGAVTRQLRPGSASTIAAPRVRGPPAAPVAASATRRVPAGPDPNARASCRVGPTSKPDVNPKRLPYSCSGHILAVILVPLSSPHISAGSAVKIPPGILRHPVSSGPPPAGHPHSWAMPPRQSPTDFLDALLTLNSLSLF